MSAEFNPLLMRNYDLRLFRPYGETLCAYRAEGLWRTLMFHLHEAFLDHEKGDRTVCLRPAFLDVLVEWWSTLMYVSGLSLVHPDDMNEMRALAEYCHARYREFFTVGDPLPSFCVAYHRALSLCTSIGNRT